MSLQPQAVTEINGKTYTVKSLTLAKARPVYKRIERLLQAVFASPEDLEKDDVSPLMIAGVAGAFSDADLEYLCKEFGSVTTVTLEDGTELFLLKPEAQEKLFGPAAGGSFEDQFTWLDFAIRHNFGGAIAKMRGALVKAEKRAQEKEAAAG